jgi:Tfp pilus assembly protein PilE
MRRKLWSESGIGLVELLIAMAVLQIGVFALIAALSSGHAALLRSAKTTTAAALASSQIELYRAMKYDDIALNLARMSAAAADDATTNYASDAAYDTVQAWTSTCVPPDADAQHACNPSSRPLGPDGKRYRVNTYIVHEIPGGGRELKKVTVVVRDPSRSNAVLLRQSTAFDELTGREG